MPKAGSQFSAICQRRTAHNGFRGCVALKAASGMLLAALLCGAPAAAQTSDGQPAPQPRRSLGAIAQPSAAPQPSLPPAGQTPASQTPAAQPLSDRNAAYFNRPGRHSQNIVPAGQQRCAYRQGYRAASGGSAGQWTVAAQRRACSAGRASWPDHQACTARPAACPARTHSPRAWSDHSAQAGEVVSCTRPPAAANARRRAADIHGCSAASLDILAGLSRAQRIATGSHQPNSCQPNPNWANSRTANAGLKACDGAGPPCRTSRLADGRASAPFDHARQEGCAAEALPNGIGGLLRCEWESKSQLSHTMSVIYRSSRANRLDVSQRLPPIFCTSA